jgi:aryl-alcohol dehydrogenase-like predicted oxidoreductase
MYSRGESEETSARLSRAAGTASCVRTEQSPYSILNREIEREVLPACRRYGMGTLTWSPLAGGLTLDDEIVPPGTDIGALDMAYLPPAVSRISQRRRPVGERAAA